MQLPTSIHISTIHLLIHPFIHGCTHHSSIYLSIQLSTHPYLQILYLPIDLSITHLSSISPSSHSPIYPSIHPSPTDTSMHHPPTHSSICPFTTSTDPYIYPSLTHPSIYLPTYPYIPSYVHPLLTLSLTCHPSSVCLSSNPPSIHQSTIHQHPDTHPPIQSTFIHIHSSIIPPFIFILAMHSSTPHLYTHSYIHPLTHSPIHLFFHCKNLNCMIVSDTDRQLLAL